MLFRNVEDETLTHENTDSDRLGTKIVNCKADPGKLQHKLAHESSF